MSKDDDDDLGPMGIWHDERARARYLASSAAFRPFRGVLSQILESTAEAERFTRSVETMEDPTLEELVIPFARYLVNIGQSKVEDYETYEPAASEARRHIRQVAGMPNKLGDLTSSRSIVDNLAGHISGTAKRKRLELSKAKSKISPEVYLENYEARPSEGERRERRPTVKIRNLPRRFIFKDDE